MMFGTLLTYYKSMRNGYVSTYCYDDAIEVIEYIAPHQPTDITHPKGINGIQFSHPDDQIASKDWWINGGTEFGKIKNILVFIYQNGRHSVLDNDIFIKNGEKYR